MQHLLALYVKRLALFFWNQVINTVTYTEL